jgi:hypothetical protein
MLMNNETENLVWSSQGFNFPGMVRIRIPRDGSCFFHAITRAYFKPYITGIIDGKAFNRKEFIRGLRKSLSIKLGKSDPKTGLRYYDSLSRGKLEDFAKSVPQYSLEEMQKELDSDRAVDNVYNEFISNEIDKDIYILDMVSKDVYITGNDFDILYKGRKSIVLLYLPGHYELVGIETRKGIKTLFSPDHEFIRAIRDRMNLKLI